MTKHLKKLQAKLLNAKQVLVDYAPSSEETMLDVMFEVPSQEDVKLVRITKRSS